MRNAFEASSLETAESQTAVVEHSDEQKSECGECFAKRAILQREECGFTGQSPSEQKLQLGAPGHVVGERGERGGGNAGTASEKDC